MHPISTLRRAALVLLAAAALTGCSEDDPTNTGPSSTTFTLKIENVSTEGVLSASGMFNTPTGSAGPAAAGPGMAYEFEVGAAPGDHLSFATMFVHSNDVFLAPSGLGIAFYSPMGMPISGDVTDQVHLWDAGTEMNQEPGLGMDQPPSQSGADTGMADAMMTVRQVDDGFIYPMASSVVAVTMTHLGDGLFRIRIENVSDSTTLMPSSGPSLAIPIAPGAYAVHRDPDPIFTIGMADRGEGLESLAEDGSPAGLVGMLAMHTSIATPVAPAAVVVHDGTVRVFNDGMTDSGAGLVALAEDGDPSVLVGSLTGQTGVVAVQAVTIPVGGAGAAPIFPGDRYETTFEATPGDYLSLMAMFVQSNDLFLSFDELGLALFNMAGNPVTGDVSMNLGLWDAGSEVNQWPGVGPDQAPRQAGPNTGAHDANTTVRMVDDGFPYPAAHSVLRVTLTVAP